jgi:hypothetical protein
MKTLLSRSLCVLFVLIALNSAQSKAPQSPNAVPGPGFCQPDFPCT